MIKEGGRNPILQQSHIFCYPNAIIYMDKPWLMVCDLSVWSSIKPQTTPVLLWPCWATPSKSQIEVKEWPGLGLHPAEKALRTLLKRCFCVLFSDSSHSSSFFFFFPAEKVLPRRKSSGSAHIPATLRPPEVLFTAHNMAL